MTTAALLALTLAAADPRVIDPAYELTLVAEAPDLVTPVSLAFDDRGRLLVVESHTHFRPEDYAGPPADRIRIVDDANGDGKADGFRTFYEGTKYTMGLRSGPDGWIYVATRMEVFRLKDADGDGAAETREEVAKLETEGDYPHNGLSGLAIGPDGKLYFGLGENLGEPYELVGRDGARLPGGGEGGNVFRCGLDGAGLERIATGFWNPFGLCFDRHGRLFAVDNDPDASPPCRLLHVVPGGDYGFQFRYGRAGKHPLQAWDGELPGTLPMAAGTGEAPCAVVPHEGRLWVTSWGHHRIERFTMRPKGATVVGVADIAVQGDENFRPVDLAVAPNGDLYFTDWVDQSYPLHGKGQLWRLKRKADAPVAETALPPLSDEEHQAEAARSELDLDFEALASADPFLHTAGVWGLVTNAEAMTQMKLRSLEDGRSSPGSRTLLGLLEAERWRNKEDFEQRAKDLKAILNRKRVVDDTVDEDMRLFTIRWIADERIESLKDEVAGLLDRDDLTPRLFRTAVAAVAWLENDDAKDDISGTLAEIMADETRPPAIRAMALRMLPAGHPSLSAERLTSLVTSPDSVLKREAVRTLAAGALPNRVDFLSAVAADRNAGPRLRADAVLGLAGDRDRGSKLLSDLVASAPPVVAEEAKRALHPPDVTKIARPSPDDLEAWTAIVGEGGDPEAGWRVFFRSNGAACARCHTLDGRGTAVGPDLTGIGRRMDRNRLLESILRPSREIAPQYVPWTLVTTDGRVAVGLPVEVRDSEGTEHFVGVDGARFSFPSAEIESRHAAETSIMPEGLEKLMTVEDLRDLLALLAEE